MIGANARRVEHRPAAKEIVLAAAELQMTFSYDQRAVVTSLIVGGRERLAVTAAPLASVVSRAGQDQVLTSERLEKDPLVGCHGNTATADFLMRDTELEVAERWTFAADATAVRLRVERRYRWLGSDLRSIFESGQPRVSWARDAWDNVRKIGDGGNVPVWGEELRRAATVRLANGARAFPTGLSLETAGNRYGVEQGDFVLLNRADRTALRVELRLNPDVMRVGTEILRLGSPDEPGPLEFSWFLTRGPIGYANGNPKGYYDTAGGPGEVFESGGHFTDNGQPVFLPIVVNDGERHDVTLTLAPDVWANHYFVGEVAGFDGPLLAGLVNDFGRSIMQDKRIGGNSEKSFRQSQAPPFTSIWNVYCAELLQDANAFASFRAQMIDIRDGLQRSDGFLRCCAPFSVQRHAPSDYMRPPTYEITDNFTNYPLAVAELFELDPDLDWLGEIKDSAVAALDYAIDRLLIKTGSQAGLIANHQSLLADPDGLAAVPHSEWNDLYHIGRVSAYHNVFGYAAFARWSDLLSSVLGDDERAMTYSTVASDLKAAFNRDVESGGFWSPVTRAYAYTRDAHGAIAKDCYHLFSNGYALQFDLPDTRQRRLAVADSLWAAYESRRVKDGWRLHGSNPIDCRTTEPPGEAWPVGLPLTFPAFENGGVHLLMEQPAAQIGLGRGDRSYAVRYARTVVDRYGVDGFWGMSSIQPDSLEVRRDIFQEPWMNNSLLGIWPLFHLVLGFQPSRFGLDLIPFIDSSLVGSLVPYRWRGRTQIEVAYLDVETYRIRCEEPIALRIGWRGREPGERSIVRFDGLPTEVAANDEGIIWFAYQAIGTHMLSIDHN